MQKKLFAFLAAAALCAGCSETPEASHPCVAAGIPPVAYLVRSVAGNRYRVLTLLPEGKNPHDHAPGTRELARAAAAPLFFMAGMPFESRLASAFGKNTKNVDITRGIMRRPLDGNHHHHDDDGCAPDAGDPHVWLSFDADIRMAETIRDALTEAFPADAENFRANCRAVQEKFAAQKAEILRKLASRRGETFFVYHPAFGYFADAVQLRQVSVEVNGRESDPAHLAGIIRMMRNAKNPVLFIQNQFSPTVARTLREECGAKLVEVDPLAEDLPGVFDRLAAALAETPGKENR